MIGDPDDREVQRATADMHRRFEYVRLRVTVRRDSHVLDRIGAQWLYRREALSVRRPPKRKSPLGRGRCWSRKP